MPTDPPAAFFSYCREDSDFALRLAEDLKAVGANVWIDQLDIEPGTPWDRAVENALSSCPNMLIVLSPISVKSDNVRDEVSFALSKQKRIIPVLYRDCDVPFRVARLQHVDFRADYDRGLKTLIKVLGVSRPVATSDLAAPASATGAYPPAPALVSEPVELGERGLATERERQEEERRHFAEQVRLEEERKQAKEEEQKRAAEKARTEEVERNRQASEKARLEQERRRPFDRDETVRTPNRSLPVVGGVMMNMALGMFYGMSVFMLPLEKEFGWTRAQTSWVTTIGLALIAVWYVIAGYIQDHRGPRPVAVIGGLLFSFGFFAASFTVSLPMFYLSAGVIAGTGSGFGYVVPTSVGSKWFPDRRGLVIGLMVGGYGAGSGVFGPLALSLIESVGWRSTFQILSVIFLVMTMTGAYLLRNPPAGYAPPGWDPLLARGAGRASADVDASAMVRMRTFWALWVAYGLGTTAGTMVISQLVPFARSSGHTATVTAFALTVGAFGSASGRVLSGWMSDYVGRLNTLRIMLVVSASAMPLLFLFRESVVLFYVLLFAVYYCYGTQLSVYASTSADFFGTKNVGFNYGLLLCAWGVAAILGPFLGGRVYVATGEYRYAFFVAAAMSIAAIATLAFARNPHASLSEDLKVRT